MSARFVLKYRVATHLQERENAHFVETDSLAIVEVFARFLEPFEYPTLITLQVSADIAVLVYCGRDRVGCCSLY